MCRNERRITHSLAAVVAAAGLAVTSAQAQDDCFADCNNDGMLNVLDFVCYQGVFQAGGDDADCNNDGLLNVLDFICFQTEFQEGCPDGPVIDKVFPTEGAPGTLVTILGQNFDQLGADEPEDLCCGAGNVAFKAIRLTDTMVQAVVLPFDPETVKGGPLEIAIGNGENQILQDPPEVADVQEPVWCWGQAPDGPVFPAGVEFVPVPDNIGPGTWFPVELVDGALCYDLTGIDWQPGDKLRIIARAWCELRHIDCELPTVQLQGDPDPSECAQAICELIQRSYDQLGVEIICTADAGKIILRYPDCEIQPGISLTSGIEVIPCPPDEIPPLQIVDVLTDGPVNEGDIVTICVEGGQTPRDFCVQAIGGCPFTPQVLVGNKLFVETGPVPPGAQPGPLLVAKGKGTLIDPQNIFIPNVEIGAIPSGFQGPEGFPFDDFFEQGVEPGETSVNTQAFVFEPDTASLVVKLEEDWETGDKIRVDVHFNAEGPNGNVTHYDCFADEVCLNVPNPDVNQCAQLICILLTQCFANQDPPVDIECDVEGNCITITAPDLGTIVSGGGTIKRTTP